MVLTVPLLSVTLVFHPPSAQPLSLATTTLTPVNGLPVMLSVSRQLSLYFVFTGTGFGVDELVNFG